MPAKQKQAHHHNASHDSSSADPGDSGEYGGMIENNMKFLNKNYSREFLAQLPAKIRGRAKLLLSFDDQFMQRKAAHDAAITALRIEYDSIYRPLFEKRRALVTGEVDVTDEDVAKGFPPEHEGKVDIKGTTEATTTNTTTDTAAADAKGLPNFWLNAFRHHVIISEMITPRDSEVLAYLTDVTAATLTNGYTVVFTFAPNPFMKGTQLHKTVYTKQEHGEIKIDHTDETAIEWEVGKDVTVELIKKKQHNKKNKNAVRYVTRMEPCESFFNMFKHHDNEDETFQWTSLLMTIYEKVVPFAVEYVTREAPDGSSDISESEMYDDDDDEDEEEEDEEDHHHQHHHHGRGGGGGGGGGRGGKGGAQKDGIEKKLGELNNQCKQQ